jgi:hypothetical protein
VCAAEPTSPATRGDRPPVAVGRAVQATRNRLRRTRRPCVTTEAKPGVVEAVGVFVATDGPVPTELGVDRATLGRAGSTARSGSAW